MQLRLLIVSLVTLALLQGPVSHAAGAIQAWNFEEGLGGWITPDSQGTLSVTHEKDAVFEGQGTLEFMFQQRLPSAGAAGEMPGTIATPIAADLSDLKAIQFSVATAYSTPLGILLNEKDGSAYVATVWSEAGKWNRCSLYTGDFALSRDSSDENNQLDLDQVASFGVADASLMVRAMSQQQALPFAVPEPVEMTIWLDEVCLWSELPDDMAANIPQQDDSIVVIDRCDSETIRWLPLGGQDVQFTAEKGAQGEPGYVRLAYVTPPGKLFGLVRFIRQGALAGCTKLELEFRNELPGMLAVAFEDTDKNHYMTMMQVGQTAEWIKGDIDFSTLSPSFESPNAPRAIDPAKLSVLAFIDVRAAEQGAISANTWQIRNVVGVK